MKKVVLSAASIAASFLLLCAAAPFSSAAVSDSHLVAPVVSGETGNRTEEDNVKALYRKYENNPAVTTVYVSSAMFDLLRNLDVSVTGSVQVDGDGGSTDVDTQPSPALPVCIFCQPRTRQSPLTCVRISGWTGTMCSS